jgi:uroporphyrinogen-III decarboxylase
MRLEQWEILKKTARLEPVDPVPVGLIVDSPWIPGYLGISTLDYLFIPEVFLSANLQVCADFPQAIFLPGFWVEMGMAAEPSGFGARMSFFADRTPVVYPIISDVSEVDRLTHPNPHCDGLMPQICAMYRYLEPQVKDAGHVIKIVAARGPLAIASHLLGVTDFLLGLKIDPDNTHRLLKICAETARDFLHAQAEALSEVEGIMLLDDLVGFLSPADYQTFAHPYLKMILDAFPGSLKFFHNDTKNPSSYPFLADLPVHVFNFTHQQPLEEVRRLVGSQICLMGSVPPMDILALGTPQMVQESARVCLAAHPDPGLILSIGGGVPPGTPGENIAALIAAAQGQQN